MQAGRNKAMQGGKQACMQGGRQEGRHAGRHEGRREGRRTSTSTGTGYYLVELHPRRHHREGSTVRTSTCDTRRTGLRPAPGTPRAPPGSTGQNPPLSIVLAGLARVPAVIRIARFKSDSAQRLTIPLRAVLVSTRINSDKSDKFLLNPPSSAARNNTSRCPATRSSVKTVARPGRSPSLSIHSAFLSTYDFPLREYDKGYHHHECRMEPNMI